MPVNTYSPGQVGTLTIQSDAMGEKMTGLLTRQTNSDGSGWDSSPQAWTKTAVGNGIDDEENTLTLTKTVAGSYVNFCSDGSRWFVDGNIVSWNEGNQYEASADFTKETF